MGSESGEFSRTKKTEKYDFLPFDMLVAKHIREALKSTKGKINGPGEAAELLGIKANTLRHRMSKLGIAYGRDKYKMSFRVWVYRGDTLIALLIDFSRDPVNQCHALFQLEIS